MEGLLASNVFNVRIDFDGWPGNHTNITDCIRPYNGSFFQIRHMYSKVFPEKEYEPLSHDGSSYTDDGIDYRKIYKIKYSVNLLPQIGQHFQVDGNQSTYENGDISLMHMMAEHSELEKFDSESLK